MKTWLKHTLVLVGFVAATLIYFSAKFDGKVIRQGDIQNWEAMVHEQKEYYEKEGGESVWCSSMFSGMPSYTVGMYSSSVSGMNVVTKFFAFFGKCDAGVVICMLFCMYALMVSLGCGTWTSVFGSVAFAFSSYSLIIIAAGHISKGWSMAYMPLVLCGMVMVMKHRKYLLGGMTFAVALTLLVYSAHYQIIYYFAILALIVFIAWIVVECMKKEFNVLGKTVATFIAGAVVAILINAPGLYSHYEVGKTSIRGASELTSAIDGKKDKSSGLDRDYAFAWSYGKAETFTLLVPNFMGGASGGEVDAKSSHLTKAFKKNGMQTPKRLQTYTYWGDQPFTSGPVYFGAIVCFLTLFALLYVRNKWTYVLFGASVFFFILSFGRNAGINNFFFDALPMYNKFRTPSMALIIPQLTFAILAALALKKYCTEIDKSFKKALFISAGIVGTICLALWLMPSSFLDFSCEQDAKAGLPDWYLNALVADREALTSSDAFRSLVFILLAAGMMFFFSKENMAKYRNYAAVGIALLTFFDLWNVDKRYLNSDNFVKEKKAVVKPSHASEVILKDDAPDYRVLTLNNPFNDTRVSYFHHSIGGYNAAKNRRYQDLIEQNIEGEMSYIIRSLQSITTVQEQDSVLANLFKGTPVLNMLNMKYLIVNEDNAPLVNNEANGAAWFASSLVKADNADDEMRLLKRADTKRDAIVSAEQMSLVEGTTLPTDGKIELTYSRPNVKKFKTSTSADAVAVFSDVYYQPGWIASIDGKEVEHVRANWILRALKIPAGEHEIEFVFHPSTYYTLKHVSLVVSWLLIISAIGLAGWYVYRKKKEETDLSVVSKQ